MFVSVYPALISIAFSLHAWSVVALQYPDAEHVQIVQVSIVDVLREPQWDRSCQEKAVERDRLLARIDRSAGSFDDKHPRWRLLEALHGFNNYRDIAGAEIDRFESLFQHVPKQQKKILNSAVKYQQNFNEARRLLKENAVVCEDIVNVALAFYGISQHELDVFSQGYPDTKAKGLRTSISQAFKHLVRDWSAEGHPERDATFPYILRNLEQLLPSPTNQTQDPVQKVLIPGAGLGRLAHEVAAFSPHYSIITNEYSAYMNIAYRWATSLSATSEPTIIYPFVETWSHARTRHELFRPISIPDPDTPLTHNLPTLIEGDFTRLPTLTGDTGTYAAVITLFFIDTARNLVQYLETIYDLLEPGGVWINVGPLLYGSAPWVQLSVDEVVAVAEEVGFVFEDHKWDEREVLYNFNQSSLYWNGYRAQYWVARKVEKGGRGWW